MTQPQQNQPHIPNHNIQRQQALQQEGDVLTQEERKPPITERTGREINANTGTTP